MLLTISGRHETLILDVDPQLLIFQSLLHGLRITSCLLCSSPNPLVICYRKVPSEEQIKDLLRKKNFEEAISLVEELQSEGEMTEEMLSFVHAQKLYEAISAIDPKKVEILQRYLQWLIEDQDSEDSQVHTTYALLLAKSAFETESTSQNSEAGNLEETNMSMFQSPIRERLHINFR
ncbi:unnamed protein product [Camellia sinensis]